MKNDKRICKPSFTKFPQSGDVVIKLKCGKKGIVSDKEYSKVKNFFKIESFVGSSQNKSGNIKVISKKYGKEEVLTPDVYDKVKDKFDIIDIIGSKKNPFNNHEYVDLGLPSGTLWATTNIGATSETEVGDYYKFGETTVYDGTDYNTSNYTLEEDLSLENDAANVNWSGDWHIPTRSQWNELIDNTTHTYISDYNSTGVNVIKFAKTNDSSTFIILPVGGSYTDGVQNNLDTGYYWSNTQYYKSAYYTVFTQNSYFHIDWKTAYGHGFLVRPVCDSVEGQGLAEVGNIICHNSELDIDAIFTYSDWIELDDSWNAIDLYGIETFDDDDEVTEERKVIMSNGITFIIKSTDYSSVSSYWEVVDTISAPIQYEYVEIGGLKWATMNVGANSITDTGLYFQWGDISGYTASQVGSGEGQKYFGWADYKYGNGTSSPSATDITKYNTTDGKAVFDASDDAVQANWGGQWRIPTDEEYAALGAAVNTTWTADYQGSGVAGFVCTDKTDNSKVLFFPACGSCFNGNVLNVGSNGLYWSSSLLSSNVRRAYYLYFNVGSVTWQSNDNRCYGFPVRGVLDE